MVDGPVSEKLRLSTKILSAYLQANAVQADQLAEIVRGIYAALGAVTAPQVAEAPVPAVSVRKSVRSDAIVCLECGKAQKTLKRHLSTAHGIEVEGYRAKYGLPSDYPLVAPDYAERRSVLAKKNGLGRKLRGDRGKSELTGGGTGVGNGLVSESGPDNGKAPAGKPPHKYPTSRYAKKEDK